LGYQLPPFPQESATWKVAPTSRLSEDGTILC
jgi:hypothetical protein